MSVTPGTTRWYESAEGACLLGTEAPGEPLPLDEGAADDWVATPFSGIRLSQYLAFPGPQRAEMAAWQRLHQAACGLTSQKWDNLRRTRTVFYAMPPSAGSDRECGCATGMWRGECHFVDTMGRFLQRRINPTVHELIEQAGLLEYPQWWMPMGERDARLRVELDCLGEDCGKLLATQDYLSLRIKTTRKGNKERFIESTAVDGFHMEAVPPCPRPSWWARLSPDLGLPLEQPALPFYFSSYAGPRDSGEIIDFDILLRKERLVSIALAVFHNVEEFNRLYFLPTGLIEEIRRECFSLPDIRLVRPRGSKTHLTWRQDIAPILDEVSSRATSVWSVRSLRMLSDLTREAPDSRFCDADASRRTNPTGVLGKRPSLTLGLTEVPPQRGSVGSTTPGVPLGATFLPEGYHT